MGFRSSRRHEQLGKSVVLSLHSRIVKRKRPLRKDNRHIQFVAFSVYAHQGQRISTDNIEPQNELGGLPGLIIALVFADGFVLFVPNLIEPLLAGDDIIQKDIDSIQAAQRQQGIALPIIGATPILFRYYGELSFQYDRKEIPIPAGRLQKRLSIRSVSCLTKSHMASTSRSAVNTSPWSATRCLDLICFVTSLSHLAHWHRLTDSGITHQPSP